ncbi:MAG: M3 family metallopeptidase [Burkholderiales bacterium]|nr:M3 family metallopeptidase [Burkholderiales bacterium]
MKRDSIESGNPLLQPWTDALGLPPFGAIDAGHFEPAFEVALAEHRAEIERIATRGEPPTFDNTAAALDRSGRLLARVEPVLRSLCNSHTSPELQAVELRLAPRLAAHAASIQRDPRLFARLDALAQRVDSLDLDAEQRRLLDRLHLDARLAGAQLAPAARQRLGQIVEQQAALMTRFAQNVLAQEQQCLWLNGEADLAGLPKSVAEAARAAAAERGRPQAWAITLSRSSVVPFLTFSERRDLRERAFRLWKGRGANAGEHDNRPLAAELLRLRAEQARLLGYASYADYALVDRMAGRPSAVFDLLNAVWEPAKRRAAREQAELEAIARQQGGAEKIEPWDWRFYAERLRRHRYALDDAELEPYFSLHNMMAALADCAGRLFGVRLVEQPQAPRYHPDVRVFEVLRDDGSRVGAFLFDNFARPGKRSGAWMNALRLQSRSAGEVLPVIVNNSNFARGAPGGPVALSLDDVRTLFHEFGHGLHGLLSNVTYERLSGTRVLRDFVELPSQLLEHWALEPSVLARHARHAATGEPIPPELVGRVLRAREFNQGFETVGYTASALVDMMVHGCTDPAEIDIAEFERRTLAGLGMPEAIAPYHHLAHFQHLFAGSYAAGYYVYLWAEVLDADGFQAFAEAGDPFDPATAGRLQRFIYSRGGAVDPAEAYRAFRGRDAKVAPLLAKRGLLEQQA